MLSEWRYDPITRRRCVEQMEVHPVAALRAAIEHLDRAVPGLRQLAPTDDWHIDQVTGNRVPWDVTSAFYERFLGAEPTAETAPTIPVFGSIPEGTIAVVSTYAYISIAPSEPGGGVTFVESGTGRLLGPHGLEPSTTMFITPPTAGADVLVYGPGHDSEDVTEGCPARVAGEPDFTIPFDSIAGGGRAVTHRDGGTWEPWAPDSLQSPPGAVAALEGAIERFEATAPRTYFFEATSGFEHWAVVVDDGSVVAACRDGRPAIEDARTFTQFIRRAVNAIDKRELVIVRIGESGLPASYVIDVGGGADTRFGHVFSEPVPHDGTTLDCSEHPHPDPP
jgi:hypothetical protein